MNTVRLRYCSLATLEAYAEEFLDDRSVAKVVHGCFGAISLGIFILVALKIPTFLYVFMYLPETIIRLLILDNNLFCTAFKFFFIPFVHYCVGASGPGLLRQLLYRAIVLPKLKRIDREDEQMQGLHPIGARTALWSRLRGSYASILHGLKGILRLTHTERKHILLPPGLHESSSALSLPYVAPNGEESEGTSGNSDNPDLPGEAAQTRGRLNDSQDHRERARQIGSEVGTWMGSKFWAALSVPLKAVIRLGELSTELGQKARAMRLLRMQRERRHDLPGDIYLP
jgi:hypothetical protein